MNTGAPISGTSHAGKAAVVTGGSRGIGFSIAEALTSAGATVAITGRSTAQLDAARTRLGGKTLTLQADVRDPDAAARAIDKAAAELGRLDILVNNAGVGAFANVADMRIDEWQQVIETNLSGVFYCTRAAIPHLRKQNGGWIINISSLASKNAFPGGAAYCATKAALNEFSEALMQEVRHERIKVSYIMPGSVSTSFGGRGDAGHADWKIAAADVAQVVLDLLAMPERSLPSRVELRPSRPPKK